MAGQELSDLKEIVQGLCRRNRPAACEGLSKDGIKDPFTQLFVEWHVSWITFLLIVNVILFIAGMFIDPNSILLVLIPTFFPVATSLGIDPVHFGIVVCLNICIGMITPPFGLDLFVASSTLRRPVELIVRGIWPFIVTNLLVLILITYVPQISTGILALTR